VAFTLMAEPVAPAVMVADVGETLREKLGGGAATVRATVAVCDRVPEVPVKVMVAVAGVAVAAAVIVRFCAAPGVRVRVTGLAVTPVGRPVMATATEPVKLLMAVASTLTVWPAAPVVRESVVGATAREKSGVAATGGVDPPLQERSVKQTQERKSAIAALVW